MKADRLERIRDHLYSHGACTAEELAAVVDASAATIRRDLVVLERQGVVDRSFGSVRIASGAGVELAFEVRERQRIAQKRAIAARAYDLLRPHGAVFLDAGTTVLQLARLLRISPMPLAVFTNGLAVAQELMHVAKLRVTLLGGALRSENASVVGPAAEAMLDRLWFDQLFLGASAIGDDAHIYSLDPAEASLNERMIERSAAVAVLADSGKFGHRATHRVAALTPSIRVITDPDLPSLHRRRLAEAGVEVTIARFDAVVPAPAGPDPTP